MNHEVPQKTKTEWEMEMLDCLERMKQDVLAFRGAKRDEALQHFQEVLTQLSKLVLHGTIPPEEPCYTSSASAN